MTSDLPHLPGLLDRDAVRATGAAIAAVQEESGAVPWFPGGHVDPWDHVECAMALLVAGEQTAADRAYRWLFATQREDGSWPMRVTGGVAEDTATDANMCAYLAVGVWHHWLVRADEAFVREAWPVVRRALDLAVGLQLPFGGIAWARDPEGAVWDEALVTGSSSIHHALGCGLSLARLVDEPQPGWQLAAGRLGHALREHEDLFAPRSRWSMDWYYPLLSGALTRSDSLDRLAARWDEFVVPGLGIRCVADRPWVTGAETAELALALETLGRAEDARVLLADVQHLRDPDGSYWTGFVYPDDARWPEERSTWTAAAVVLTVDALSDTTPGAGIFRPARQACSVPEIGLTCGCRSADRVAGVSGHPA